MRIHGNCTWEILSWTPQVQWPCGISHKRNEETLGKNRNLKFQPALTEWRNTRRVSDGFNPAQWALGRRQRANCHALLSAYDRITDQDLKKALARREEMREKAKVDFDGTQKILPSFNIGANVYKIPKIPWWIKTPQRNQRSHNFAEAKEHESHSVLISMTYCLLHVLFCILLWSH